MSTRTRRFPILPSMRRPPVLLLRERVHEEVGFTLTSIDGKTYSLAGLHGKVILLNFWATWCQPCGKEMPAIEALYRQFKAKGLVVLAVSNEHRETVAGFLAKQNYTFPRVARSWWESDQCIRCRQIQKALFSMLKEGSRPKLSICAPSASFLIY